MAREMTTVVVPVPEPDPLVGHWRKEYDWSASAGVPAHITLLGPFLPPDRVGPEVLRRLSDLFASCRPLRFTLASVRCRSGVVYLEPEPRAPFRRLTRMLETEWPEVPSYGGGHEQALYHLTLAREVSAFDQIREELAGYLPIGATAREALLLEKRSEPEVRTLGCFTLGGH